MAVTTTGRLDLARTRGCCGTCSVGTRSHTGSWWGPRAPLECCLLRKTRSFSGEGRSKDHVADHGVDVKEPSVVWRLLGKPLNTSCPLSTPPAT